MNHPLYKLLRSLDKAKIHYTLSRDRDDTVRVNASFIGERLEVDVFEDGHMEVSRFLGTEDILGGRELIYELIDKALFENKAWEDYTLKTREPD